jgi:hypothetical protein
MPSTATTESAMASRRQINTVFVAILLGMLLAALDQTIVSTALPTIVADLGGAGHMTWVVTAYLLAETIATVLAVLRAAAPGHVAEVRRLIFDHLTNDDVTHLRDITAKLLPTLTGR